MQRIAVYAGSFDPITYGHIDIIRRAITLFDKVFIIVARNSGKQPMFTFPERVRLIEDSIDESWNVEIRELPEKALLIKLAKELRACAMIRGLRPVQDFPGEFALASINRKLDSGIETVMLITDESVSSVSSSMVKEVAMLGGSIEQFAPEPVVKAVLSKTRL